MKLESLSYPPDHLGVATAFIDKKSRAYDTREPTVKGIVLMPNSSKPDDLKK